MMPMMFGGYGGYGMGLFGGFFMMLIPLVLIGLVVYWVVKFGSKNSFKTGGADALDILKTRYAKGEIAEDEYKKLKDELSR